MATCHVCFRQCSIAEGKTGACGARICREGTVQPAFYGQLSSIALDPIEKKPLRNFHPGSLILSVGSLGCNLHCPFCQNHMIAQAGKDGQFAVRTEPVGPEELVKMAVQLRREGNIGIAFTYNEPLVGYEYVRDTARLAHEKGLLCVLVTNGTAALPVLEEIAPYIDAMNIDLKGFTDRYYREILQGDRGMTLAFIREAVRRCHVELTTLIVPGENDTREEILALSAWIAGLRNVSGGKSGSEIPLHVSRFFPQYRMLDRGPTDVGTVYSLAEAARQHLCYVYTGNC